MNIFYKVIIMFFINGAAAAVSFILLAREMSCQAGPDARLLAAAFAALAASALIARAFSGYYAKKGVTAVNMALSFSSILLAFSFVAGIFIIRYSRPAASIPAELALPAVTAAAVLAAVFAVSGTLYFTSVRAGGLLASPAGPDKSGVISMSGAAGAVAGLAVYSFFLWKHFTALDTVYSLGILMLSAVYILFRDKTTEGRITMLAVIISFIIYLGFNVGGVKEKADRHSSRAAFSGYEIIVEKEFPTVRLLLAKKGGSYFVFENGLLTSEINDSLYAEAAKLANGRNILVINGGIAGMAEALLARPGIEKITCAEEDAFAAHVLKKVFAETSVNKVSAEIVNGGLNAAAAKGVLYDTVFINPRPATIGLYSGKNMELIRDTLAAPGGLIVISGAAATNPAVMKTAAAVFGGVKAQQGFLTAKKPR